MQYESERVEGKENVLKETLNELKIEAGLTEVLSPGIVINIEYAEESLILGETIRPVTGYLLQKLD